MPTCSVQMPINVKIPQNRNTAICKRTDALAHARINGFTLTELIVAVALISLFMLLTVTNLFGLLRKNTFKAQIQDFVSTMQMAVAAAAESNRRYEVIIDLVEQNYTLRQITSPHLPSDVLEEEIIVKNDFSENCYITYVIFDDLVETDEDVTQAFFRAGHAGWQNGGKILLLDQDDQEYSVIVNRINRIVKLEKGDVELPLPKRQEEIPF